MKKTNSLLKYLLFLSVLLSASCSGSERITSSVSIGKGPINGVMIKRNGKELIVYGDPLDKYDKVAMVLFTHFRRDVIWCGRDLVSLGAIAVAPLAERAYFESCDSIWADYDQSRFHDYYCQTTKIGAVPLRVDRYVRGDDRVRWEDIDFRVLDTPGYTRGAVSYVADIDGKRIAFTGDLICGDGKVPDLYSFQDSFQQIRGYHGYASRLVELISSLEKVEREKPDIIIPDRGPVITDPESAIKRLIGRVRALYSNYLSITAYRWYYPDQVNAIADSIAGPVRKADWLPLASLIVKDPPSWYVHFSNSNLVMADDSNAFLIDCGTRDAFDELVRMKKSHRLKGIQGLFLTHYHDDHTDLVNDVVSEFGCPVYATTEMKDILENPSAYHLPCLTTHPVRNLIAVESGFSMNWKDFRLTFSYFPGQTLYHDALLFEKRNGGSVLFAGDSFTPSGIDDYCLLNRNFLHQGMGYFYCLDMLRKLPAGVLISNQHVGPLFSFTDEQLTLMTNILNERVNLLKELLPGDDINYGIDEQWARIYPYGQSISADGTAEFTVKIFNHSGTARTFIVRPDVREGLTFEPAEASVAAGSLSEGEQKFRVSLKGKTEHPVSLITVSIRSEDMELREWCESLLKIQ